MTLLEARDMHCTVRRTEQFLAGTETELAHMSLLSSTNYRYSKEEKSRMCLYETLPISTRQQQLSIIVLVTPINKYFETLHN